MTRQDPVNRPRVSVITPFLNEERFISEAIASVLAQTYGDWELLLVDDGSTDNSPRIARQAAERSPSRVHYLRHPGGKNLGMSRSRNLGIEHARGEFVAFLDGDDVYLPEKLERQVQILDEHPTTAMVYGATQHWYSWSGREADQDRDTLRKLGVEPDRVIAPPALMSKFLRGEAQTPGMCGVLIRRSILLDLGGFEPKFRGMFEDAVMISKICLTFPVFVQSHCSDRYRQHSDSHSQLMQRRGLYRKAGPSLTHARFARWLASYANQLEIDDPEFLSELQQLVAPYQTPLSYAKAVSRLHIESFKEKLLGGRIRSGGRSGK